MTRSTNIVFRNSRALIVGATLLAVLTFSASAARATPDAGKKATPVQLQLGVSTPIIVPFGYSSSVGVGVMPGVQLSLGKHWGINLTAGYIHYTNAGEYTEREIPILFGVSYTFMSPLARARPYLTARMGYTHSRRDGRGAHWLTAVAGGGAIVRLGRGVALDVGGAIVVSDLAGKADETVGLLLKIGLAYRI